MNVQVLENCPAWLDDPNDTQLALKCALHHDHPGPHWRMAPVMSWWDKDHSSVGVSTEETIKRVIQYHTNEPDEEAGFIAYDIRIALGLPEELEI